MGIYVGGWILSVVGNRTVNDIFGAKRPWLPVDFPSIHAFFIFFLIGWPFPLPIPRTNRNDYLESLTTDNHPQSWFHSFTLYILLYLNVGWFNMSIILDDPFVADYLPIFSPSKRERFATHSGKTSSISQIAQAMGFINFIPLFYTHKSMAISGTYINWRYLPYIRPI
jgi:hypothetical protein